MNSIRIHATRCPISGEEGDATELYPATFDADSFSPLAFSARKLPEGVHFRIVRSNRSGLIRSDPIVDPALLSKLYEESSFNYGAEVHLLKQTYGRYLERVCALGCPRGSLLEIGCGNGFLLERAKELGFENVWGVESSRHAIDHSSPSIRERTVCDIMRPNLFSADEFDLICMFHVFDHLPDPNEVLAECRRVLKPGGFILCLNHNIESWSARILGEKGPIIDIEHTYLYSHTTIRRIFEINGYQVKEQGNVWNKYSLSYLFFLLPLPRRWKDIGLRILRAVGLGRVSATLPLGNLYLIGRKP